MPLYVGLSTEGVVVSDDFYRLPLDSRNTRTYLSPIKLGHAVNEYAAEFAGILNTGHALRIETSKRRSRETLGQFLGQWHRKYPKEKFKLQAAPCRASDAQGAPGAGD